MRYSISLTATGDYGQQVITGRQVGGYYGLLRDAERVAANAARNAIGQPGDRLGDVVEARAIVRAIPSRGPARDRRSFIAYTDKHGAVAVDRW